jgi:ribonuclease D
VQTATPGVLPFLQAVIESDEIVKVGFGLASDRPQIQRRLGLRLGRSIDLSHLVKRLGFKDAVGLKVAVAVVLGQRFIKSKKATTSNWANPTLTPQQLQYAANDAHASLLVYKALNES